MQRHSLVLVVWTLVSQSFKSQIVISKVPCLCFRNFGHQWKVQIFSLKLRGEVGLRTWHPWQKDEFRSLFIYLFIVTAKFEWESSKRESGMVICFLRFSNTRNIMLAWLTAFSFVKHAVLYIWLTEIHLFKPIYCVKCVLTVFLKWRECFFWTEVQRCKLANWKCSVVTYNGYLIHHFLKNVFWVAVQKLR